MSNRSEFLCCNAVNQRPEEPAPTVTADDQGHAVVSSAEPLFDALVVPADRVLRINPRDCSDLNQTW